MKTKIHAILIVLASLALAACSSPEARIKKNPQLFASIPAAEQELIKQGRIAIGFTPDMVKLALGEPDLISRRIDRTGTAEIWRYQNYDTTAYGYYGGYWGGYWGSGWYGARYPYWRGSYWGGWGSYWGAPMPVDDYMRVTIKDGQVVEINQIR